MSSATTPQAVADDPLQLALEEAEQFLQDDTAMQGFSIDSDDEDDRATNGNGNKANQAPGSALDHPLQDPLKQEGATQWNQPPLSTTSTDTTATATTASTFVHPQMGTPTANMTPSHTNGFPPVQPTSYGQHNNTPNAMTPNTNAGAAGLWKAQTFQFAGQLASMAKTAATQMQDIAQGVHVPTQSTPMQAHTHVQPIPEAYSATPQAPPAPLDSAQTATWMAQHVEDVLMEGERVLMLFAAGQVYDSGNQAPLMEAAAAAASSSPGSGVTWGCAVTYYRLLLFPIADSSNAQDSTSVTSPMNGSSGPMKHPTDRPESWNTACWPRLPSSSSRLLLQIPLASIDKVEKTVFATRSGVPTPPAASPSSLLMNGGAAATGATGGSNSVIGLVITGKDNGRQLRFTTPFYADTLRAHESLQTYAFPGRRNLGYLFAFESKRNKVMNSLVVDQQTGQKKVTLEPTPKRFDGVQEFTRQFQKGANDQGHCPWTIWTSINATYQTCMSYPNVLAGPASLDENMPEGARVIRNCAVFRSENRFPVLTWSSGVDGASLWRASQPKVGLQGNRSSADELLLKHIFESAASANALSHSSNPPAPLSLSRAMLVQLTGSTDLQNWVVSSDQISRGRTSSVNPTVLKILDLRPRSSAMANRTGGYGYENTSYYTGTTLQFCNIGNIHAVRDAYQKVSQLCTSPSTNDLNWHSSLEDTKWTSSIRTILAAAWEAAYWVHIHRLPVLLHCSHGWDRTGQVAVLAQLLLDPFYRTRKGFATLVEKDFMSFGHPFHTRCAHGEGRGESGGASAATGTDEGQKSPIFIQFLDCVFQLVNQYPECFEFNTKYLLCMSEHIYSCRFGNFLCDSEREREMVAGIRQRTHCIWDYLESRDDTRNSNFCEQTAGGVMLMPLPTLMRNVTLWIDRHAMHGSKATMRWLPADIDFSGAPKGFENDQQGPLATTHEAQELIIGNTATNKLSSSHVGSENQKEVGSDTLPSVKLSGSDEEGEDIPF